MSKINFNFNFNFKKKYPKIQYLKIYKTTIHPKKSTVQNMLILIGLILLQICIIKLTKIKKMKTILTLLFTFISLVSFSQTTLKGKVIDDQMEN